MSKIKESKYDASSMKSEPIVGDPKTEKDDDVESEANLYPYHEIKKEMVIGPVVFQQAVHSHTSVVKSEPIVVDVKTEKDYDVESEADLYPDHEIKKEMARRPVVFQQAVHSHTTAVKSEPIVVDVKTEKDDDLESEANLYPYHEIKKEMVIGPVVFQQAVRSHTSAVKSEPIVVDVKIEKDYGVESEADLYPDHEIKKEMVIGPVVFQQVAYCITNHPEDEPFPEEPRLETKNDETDQVKPNKEIRAYDSEEITSNVDKRTSKARKRQVKNKAATYKIYNYRNRKQSPKMLRNLFIICNDCGKRFVSKSALAVHIRSHEAIKQDYNLKGKERPNLNLTQDSVKQSSTLNANNGFVKKIREHDCEYRTDEMNNDLMKPLQNQSKDPSKPFFCSMCEYTCAKRGLLTRHVVIHTGEKPFSCSLCDYKCAKKHNLTRHLLIHSGEKRYSCPGCDFKSSVKISLTRHLCKLTGEKPYSCSECDYKSNLKISLKEHIRIHTGEKPYSCHLCDYKCAAKTNLTKHLRTHAVKKAYSCSLCKYTSSYKSALTTHLRLHTGEKPYSCSICEFTSSNKSSLRSHLRRHRKK